YDSAIYYFQKSLQVRENLESPGEQTQALISLGETYLAMDQPKTSTTYLNRAKELSKEAGFLEDYRNALENLAVAYEKLNEYRKAYQTHVEFKTIADSIINDKKKQDIVRLEEQFAYEKKEDSIQYVQRTERVQFEKEITNQRARVTGIVYGVVVLLLLIMTLGLLYYYKRKANEKLIQLNDEVQKQKDHLERLNAMKSRLFSIVSHDIKSPIGILTGFSEVLINHVSETYDIQDDQELKTIKKHLNDGKDRLLVLLEDLINWVKSENGTMPFRPDLLEAKPLIASTIDNVKSHAESKEIEIELQLDSGSNFYGDANTLKVIFRNLLNNAVKFTKQKGKVSIYGSLKNGSTEIIISDT
ncbi:MAG: tetratricopeptide repeat-containing sensor histidine kinase, partial [Bacteroidota bacterium]